MEFNEKEKAILCDFGNMHKTKKRSRKKNCAKRKSAVQKKPGKIGAQT